MRACLALTLVGCAAAAGPEDLARGDGGATVSDGSVRNTDENGVTVTLAGNGVGMVVSSPAGLTCPGACSQGYTGGTTVTLTATPSASSTFTGWTGGGCSGTATCVVIANGQVDVTATFTKDRATLTVSKAGTGAGVVTSLPLGIDCGATCVGTFDVGTMVALDAVPSPGSTFAGWSGGCSGTATTCQVAIAAQNEVTATFTFEQYPLTITKSGLGSGTVASVPAGLSCGATCSASFAAGTSVTLTATPAAGSVFAGWSGAGCAGVAGCVVAMTAAQTVNAVFNVPNVTCTTVNTANACTNDVINEINLGGLGTTACHDQCQARLRMAAVAKGCWIIASNNICYCRGGTLSTGNDARPGGSCT